MAELERDTENELRQIGREMLEAGDSDYGVCIKGNLQEGIFLHVQVVKVKDGKVLNANV